MFLEKSYCLKKEMFFSASEYANEERVSDKAMAKANLYFSVDWLLICKSKFI
jgi:hypothetical protein